MSKSIVFTAIGLLSVTSLIPSLKAKTVKPDLLGPTTYAFPRCQGPVGHGGIIVPNVGLIRIYLPKTLNTQDMGDISKHIRQVYDDKYNTHEYYDDPPDGPTSGDAGYTVNSSKGQIIREPFDIYLHSILGSNANRPSSRSASKRPKPTYLLVKVIIPAGSDYQFYVGPQHDGAISRYNPKINGVGYSINPHHIFCGSRLVNPEDNVKSEKQTAYFYIRTDKYQLKKSEEGSINVGLRPINSADRNTVIFIDPHIHSMGT